MFCAGNKLSNTTPATIVNLLLFMDLESRNGFCHSTNIGLDEE
jgi:hypothetical protein